MKKLLNRKELLQKEKLEVVEVDLGNDECVYVRQMTGHERDQFEQSLLKEVKDDKGNANYERSLSDYRAKLVVGTICDADGNGILNPGDYESLSHNMGIKRLEKIVEASQKLNAITEIDKQNILKNSKADPESSSSSVSAKN